MYSNGRLIIAGDDEGATLIGMNYCYETLLVVRPAMFFCFMLSFNVHAYAFSACEVVSTVVAGVLR